MIGLEEKEPKARKAAGLIVIHVVKIRRPVVKSVLLVGDQVEKNVQNIHHVALPPRHAVREASGAKNPREVRKDDNKT